MKKVRAADVGYSSLKKRIYALRKEQMALTLLAIMDGANFISALRLAEEKMDDFKKTKTIQGNP